MTLRRLLPPLFFLASIALSAPSSALQLDATLGGFAPATTADTERAAITDYLRANLGEPYRFGATGGREGFDCSGLVLRAYAAAGLQVPRISTQQFRVGTPVSPEALRAGDLLFYRMRQGKSARLHVVVYIGDGRAIHASVGHKQVREIDITRKVWSSRLVAARTLL